MYLAITVQPVSINTTVNATVIFTCVGVGNTINVEVNETQATDTTLTGFIVETFSGNGTISAELRATAYEDNNNTNISCRIDSDTDNASVSSDVAILMIQG